MDDLTLDEALDELSSAEDFLEYFEIDYVASVVHVNRLHILQRFHDYINREKRQNGSDDYLEYDRYKFLLQQAYQDFVESNALTEKVFKVFKTSQPGTAFVSLEQIAKG